MNPQRLQDIALTLEIVARDLRSLVAPELQSASTQSIVSMIDKLLDMLALELRGTADLATPAARKAAITVQAALSSSDSPIDLAIARSLHDALQMNVGDNGAATAMPGLLELAAQCAQSAASVDVWRHFDALAAITEIRDSGRSDVAWDASFVESGAGAQAEKSDNAVQRVLDVQSLGDYIRRFVPGGAGAEIVRLKTLPGGYSKGTFIAELRLDDGSEQAWVLRRDLPFTPLDTCVVDEYPLLRALHAQGLPVAEPLWLEADPSHLGAPVMAVRKIDGSGDMTEWAQQPGTAQDVAYAAARLLATIHRTDPASLPKLQTAAPGCGGTSIESTIAHLEAFWNRHRIEANPLVELLFSWLRRNQPAPVPRGLVHGDFGLHNLLVAHGRINAILDWEFAHIGDPREDLAYAQPFVEKVLPWPEFARAYREAGGIDDDPEALRFYSVFGMLRNALGCMKVLHALRSGGLGIDAKFIYVGRSYAQQLLRRAANLTGMF